MFYNVLNLIFELKNISTNKSALDNYGKYNNFIELVKYNPFDDIKKQIIILNKITPKL